MQDGPAYNHLGYTQNSNLTNPKPTPTLILTPSFNRNSRTLFDSY